jgi:hypothetical protein
MYGPSGMHGRMNENTLLVGKPEGRRPFGRPKCGWKDNIKMVCK